MNLKKKKIKRICVVTSSRADYGLLSKILKKIKKDRKFNLQIIVTGSHLEKKYGFTINEIIKDGFKPSKKIKLDFKNDSFQNLSLQFSKAINHFTKCFIQIKPDFVLLLGDRYEIFAAAVASFFAKIKIGHINGGEITEGAIDDSFRHCITKLSDFHYTANPIYRRRVIQLGENPRNVLMTGGLGAEIIKEFKPLSKQKLQEKLNFKFGKKNLLVTIHPDTTNYSNNRNFIHQTLLALDQLKETKIFFTYPNFDPGNEIIKDHIIRFRKKRVKNIHIFKSLGVKNYLSFLKYVDAVVGNSSSGVSEAPSFKIASINIGDRQKGRVFANSIINCKIDNKLILKSIKKIYNKKFKRKIKNTKNPYYSGKSSEKIISSLKKVDLSKITTKSFFNNFQNIKS